MKKTAVSIGLINPKSPSNVGAVMRAAGCYGAEAVFYTGGRFGRAARFSTDTKHSSLTIPLTGVADILDGVGKATRIVCVELVVGATALPEYRHPDKAFYIFGPEDGTIAQEILDQADAVVYVPTIGCMNLAAAVNVVLYDRLAKSAPVAAGDALIVRSRDTNNRAKVKSAGSKAG